MQGWTTMRKQRAAIIASALSLIAGSSDVWPNSTVSVERVSVGRSGRQANNTSEVFAISSSGEEVAFISGADNLAPRDTNAQYDAFVRVRTAGDTERVSLGSRGRRADLGSFTVAISGNGRFVAFGSKATNLVPGDTNGEMDIFVHDRIKGRTERVNVGPGGQQANGSSYSVSISTTGRYVAFDSGASNLVPNGDHGGGVFVRDRVLGTTSLVSRARKGQKPDSFSFSPAISANGRFVAFSSGATNLVAGDTNASNDIFVHDRWRGITRRVSVASDGREGDLESGTRIAISRDGRFVTFESVATNLVRNDRNDTSDIFLHDMLTSRTIKVSSGPGGVDANSGSYTPSISTDGRYIAFLSSATNLTSGHTNGREEIYVFDRVKGKLRRIDVHLAVIPPDGGINGLAISGDGGSLAFASSARNHVPHDTNGVPDVFVVGR